MQIPPKPSEGAGLLSHQGRSPTRLEQECEDTVAAWVGEEGRPEVFAAMRRPVPTMAELVQGVVARIQSPEAALLARIQARWTEVAGAENAKQLTPLQIRGKTLVLEAANPTWLFLFRQPQLQGRLLESLKRLTQNQITGLSFVAKGRR